jgi:hypothetical protein
MQPLTEDEARRQAVEAARFLGFPLDDAFLDGVAANLRLLADHAARFMDLPLPPDREGPAFDATPSGPSA